MSDEPIPDGAKLFRAVASGKVALLARELSPADRKSKNGKNLMRALEIGHSDDPMEVIELSEWLITKLKGTD